LLGDTDPELISNILLRNATQFLTIIGHKEENGDNLLFEQNNYKWLIPTEMINY